jgi:hypothetical protein
MIVNYSDAVCVVPSPLKDHSKLIVDPYAMVCCQIAFDPLQPIPRWNSKILEVVSGIEHIEFSSTDRPTVLRHMPSSLRIFAIEDVFSGLVADVQDHGITYRFNTYCARAKSHASGTP